MYSARKPSARMRMPMPRKPSQVSRSAFPPAANAVSQISAATSTAEQAIITAMARWPPLRPSAHASGAHSMGTTARINSIREPFIPTPPYTSPAATWPR